MGEHKRLLEELGVLRGAARRARPAIKAMGKVSSIDSADLAVRTRSKLLNYSIEQVVIDCTFLIAALDPEVDVDNDGLIFVKKITEIVVEHTGGEGYVCIPCATQLQDEGEIMDSPTPLAHLSAEARCYRCKCLLHQAQQRKEESERRD